MPMTLRLTDDETEALRRRADLERLDEVGKIARLLGEGSAPSRRS